MSLSSSRCGRADEIWSVSQVVVRVDDDIAFKEFDSEKSNKEWFQYYTDKADHAFDQERIHMESAAKASERGDESAAKDHLARAKSWHSDGEKYLRSAKLYK